MAVERLSSRLQPGTHLQVHLEVRDLAVLDVAAALGDPNLEPIGEDFRALIPTAPKAAASTPPSHP